MMSVLDFPVAEQYPSSTDTSEAGSSKRVSHISDTTGRNKKRPALPSEARAEGGRAGLGMIAPCQRAPFVLSALALGIFVQRSCVDRIACGGAGNKATSSDYLQLVLPEKRNRVPPNVGGFAAYAKRVGQLLATSKVLNCFSGFHEGKCNDDYRRSQARWRTRLQ